MHAKDLDSLDFPRVREFLAGFCHSEPGRELALAVTPSTDIDWMRKRLAESAESRLLLEAEPDISVSGLSDLSVALRQAELGRTLDPPTLAEISRNLRVIRALKSAVSSTSFDIPLLTALAKNLVRFDPLEKAIDRVVTTDGQLQPGASPELVAIRNRMRSRRDELTNRLQGIIADESSRRFIQEPVITERAGRFALAVKAEYKNEIKGFVHDVSNTGSTVFLEPFATLDLGNELKELDIAEAREIERLLAEISARIGQSAPSIVESIRIAANLDVIMAKARYARRAHAVEALVYSPEVESAQPALKLVEARHPLLGDKAVPLSIELGLDFQLLVVTGPNTGGKTVALKTIGLLALMTQSGLPIPAEAGSRLPVFPGIFADIGDEQSVQASLSTFSGHISNIARILHSAAPGSLVLLDELGASTDPREGSALAGAILRHLAANGCIGAVTTHFSELKVFAHITPGLRNASFDFDPDTFKPTYRLTMGLPGGSNALATAARYGLAQSIIDNARNSLSADNRRLEELLSELNSEKQRLETIRRHLEQELSAASASRSALAGELSRLREEKQAMVTEARDAVVAEVALLEKELRRARNSLEKENTRQNQGKARLASQQVQARLHQGILTRDNDSAEATGDELPAPGDRVWLKEPGIEGRILSINEKTGQAEISAGALRFRLEKSGFTQLTSQPEKLPSTAVSFHSAGGRVPLELDLRGRRIDEAEALVDEYLNDAATANLSEVRVIHGHGTGALRDAVRQLSARHPLVASFAAAPQSLGGNGATTIRLR
ncbi:MutS2 family protein [Dehalogenimonas lykanthroporepellens BL-DC-9]|jgi:DNA mismatch repair protein MutS2|nr:MutS2 family protein [Dehalogenimonas lykanthroporepellens BL-DC-9]